MKRDARIGLLYIVGCTCCSDVFAGPYYDAIVADDPVAYWRLGESDGSSAANEGLLGDDDFTTGLYTDDIQLGQSSLVLGEDNSSVLFTPGGRMTTEPFEKFDQVAGVGSTL